MSSLARMIDANLNRTSEGLRVLEDAARFHLDSLELCSACKSARHGLRQFADELAATGPAFDRLARLASRDTPGDVGTEVSTESEMARHSMSELAAAAGARTAEALRVLEESAKLAGSVAAAQRAKSLRYEVYELSRRILVALGTGRARQWSLCVLITESLCKGRPWTDVVTQAIDGGADCIQLREKDLADRELLDRARWLVGIARPRGVSVIVNDRADIALAAGADGVHVGQDDMPIAQIRAMAGSRLLVGVSTTNMDQAREAASLGADVCGVGPMFPTTTKHKPQISGPAYLAAYLADPATTRVPHLAIGGIGPENVRQLAAAGCRGIAVSSCVCSADDPAEVCRVLRRELEAALNLR